jgi:hypothetical protein
MGAHEDWLRAAAFLFERERRGRLDLSDFDEWISEAGLDCANVGDVEARIMGLLESGELESSDRQSAYGALKYSGNDRLVPFLRNRLTLEIGCDDMRAATQAMFALEAMGEDVFAETGRLGISFDEDEPNRRDAVAYLGRFAGA